MINPKPGLVKAVMVWLRKKYPDENRWVLNGKASLKGNYKVDLVLDEMNGVYRNRTVIRVVHNPQVSDLDVKGLNDAAKKMSGRYVKIIQKIIFTVRGADTAAVPQDFKVQAVTGFSFIGNEVFRD